MIVNSERALAIICPACQSFEKHKFSLFAISQEPFQLSCSCGFSQGHVSRTNKGFELDVLTISGEWARIRLTRKEFFYTPLLNLFSSQTGQHVGYLGNPEQVHQQVVHSPQLLPGPSEFINPEVMAEILELLQELAQREKIRCECEHSSIGIDIYADRVELVCAYCGGVVQIGAVCGKHRERLARVTEIVMEPSTSKMLGEWLKPLT